MGEVTRSDWTSRRTYSRCRRGYWGRAVPQTRTGSSFSGFLRDRRLCCRNGSLRGSALLAREIGKLGHPVRLIPPAYVKPFVKRQKNDAADAEAICEAAQRPTMRFVPVKSEEQPANSVVFEPAISWCVSALSASTPCAGTWRSTATSFREGSRMSPAWLRGQGSGDPRCRRARVIVLSGGRHLHCAGSRDRRAGCRDQAALEGRPDRTTVDDDPRRGPNRRNGNHRAGAGGGELPGGTRLRRLARLTPLQKSTGGKQKLGAVSKRR